MAKEMVTSGTDEPVIEEVAFEGDRVKQAPVEDDGQGDGFGDFGDFEEENENAGGEDDLKNEESEQKSFTTNEETEKPAAPPKKPLTESDLLSGFMSAFGSNLSRKMTVQPGKSGKNSMSNQGDSELNEASEDLDGQESVQFTRA